MQASLDSVQQLRNTLLDLAIRFGPRLFAAILILIVGSFVSRWAMQWLAKVLRRIELEPPVRVLLLRIARLLVFLLFVVLALQNLGIELLPLIAGLGVAGAAIALAMQGVLGNVAAGLSIIFTKPFRVGEYISIANEEGRVEMITLFSTTLSHIDRSLIVIPNRKIAGEILHNFGMLRQLDLTVGLTQETDFARAFGAIDAVLKQNPRVIREPEPVVRIEEFAASAITVAIKPWVAVNDYVPAIGELNLAIAEALRRDGIRIALPQREVRLIAAQPDAARTEDSASGS